MAIVVAVVGALGIVGAAIITASANGDQDTAETVPLLRVRCQPATVPPGSRVTMLFDVRAHGDEGARIGLGATLYLGDGEEIYDGEGDRTV